MVVIPEVSVEVLVAPVSIAELFTLYLMSDNYLDLAVKSKHDYNYYANALLNSVYATRPLEYITPQTAITIYKSVKTTNGVYFANGFCRVWSVIYGFAQEKSWIAYNPWSLVKKDKPPTRDTVWTQEAVYKIVRIALDDDRPYSIPVAKAVMLLYETGQRPSDVLRMSWADLIKDDSGSFVKLRQLKTGNFVTPAITNETRDLLEVANTGHEKLIGVDWKMIQLQCYYRVFRNAAGLSDKLQMRDLRRTALTEAGAGGATDDQMKAHSGHSSRTMLDTYSVSSRKKALEAHRARFKKCDI